MLHRAVFL